MPADTAKRQLADSDVWIQPVALGCWPIAGMTSLDVNLPDSLATIEAALAAGINMFDTAHCYGADCESERYLGQILAPVRDRVVIATKGGIHWNHEGQRTFDARPDVLRSECATSLQLLNTDHIDLLYLHAPDPKVPVADSAGALRGLLDEGKTRAVGVSNLSVSQMEAFYAECPIAAVQPPYNMLQRQIEQNVLPWCRERGIAVLVYWPLMKGLLAGRLPRDFVFQPRDGRAKYPMFQGEEWKKNQDFVDKLREIAQQVDRTVAQVVINWTIHQPGITAALCGAKRPYQIQETAGAMGWQLDAAQQEAIAQALRERGTPVVGQAV